jgi:putative toxin-antitoxin system antitoxin component (TIGR02293 family)
MAKISKLVGLRASEHTALDLVPVVREGIRYRSLVDVAKHARISIDELVSSLGIARRTLDRRKASGRLDPRTSEKLVRLARVVTRAEEVLGSANAMRAWLRAPNRALGDATPLSMLDTDLGAETVVDLLGRLEHGVYS